MKGNRLKNARIMTGKSLREASKGLYPLFDVNITKEGEGFKSTFLIISFDNEK